MPRADMHIYRFHWRKCWRWQLRRSPAASIRWRQPCWTTPRPSLAFQICPSAGRRPAWPPIASIRVRAQRRASRAVRRLVCLLWLGSSKAASSQPKILLHTNAADAAACRGFSSPVPVAEADPKPAPAVRWLRTTLTTNNSSKPGIWTLEPTFACVHH